MSADEVIKCPICEMPIELEEINRKKFNMRCPEGHIDIRVSRIDDGARARYKFFLEYDFEEVLDSLLGNPSRHYGLSFEESINGVSQNLREMLT